MRNVTVGFVPSCFTNVSAMSAKLSDFEDIYNKTAKYVQGAATESLSLICFFLQRWCFIAWTQFDVLQALPRYLLAVELPSSGPASPLLKSCVSTFDAMLLTEPDVRIVRALWIDAWVRRMLGAVGFWVLGSAFRGTKPIHFGTKRRIALVPRPPAGPNVPSSRLTRKNTGEEAKTQFVSRRV